MGLYGGADADHLWHHVSTDDEFPAAWASLTGCLDALIAHWTGADHRQPDPTPPLDGSILRFVGAVRLGALPAAVHRGVPAAGRGCCRDQLAKPDRRCGDLCA